MTSELISSQIEDYVEQFVPDRPLEMVKFDLIFNDIDKHAYPDAFPVINEKLRASGVLIVDNMLLGGDVFDKNDNSPDTNGVREFTRDIIRDANWIASLIPIRDGLVMAYKK